MALISITYCNASTNEIKTFDYDDVNHTIINNTTLGPCDEFESHFFAGEQLYVHDDAGTRYFVRVSNSLPFAYVESVPVPACSVVINSVGITNASNDGASDGVININATGNGTLQYSIDGGLTWVPVVYYLSTPTDHIFSGLAPGVYNVKVKNLFFDGLAMQECFDEQTVTVGYDALATCDLVLGNVSATIAPGATLTVIDYATAYSTQPVQYRLDAGAWQDSNVFTGLAAGTYSVQIRFKNFTSCTSSRNFTVVAATPCTILIPSVSITHEQAKFADNGSIVVNATSSNGPIQYSKDNGANYQSSNTFSFLSPGTYTIRVKDANNCEAFVILTINAYKLPSVTFPIANSNRVVITSGPVMMGGAQNFDNTLFKNMKFPGRVICDYAQKFATTDAYILQWRSSYIAHTVKVYNDSDVLQASLAPVKRTSNIGQTETMTPNFSNYGAGKTQIWFPLGMPTFFAVGMDVTISGEATLNGTYEIEGIALGVGEAVGYSVLIIDKNYTSGTDPLTATLDILYDIEDFDEWEVAVDWAAFAAGKYYLKFEGTDDQFATFTAQSEPIETVTDVSDLVLMRYNNVDNAFQINYSTDILHLIRVEGELVPADAGGEREVMEDSRRRIIKLRENVTRQVALNVYDIPPYLAEKIRVGLAHDYVALNDVEYQPVDEMAMEFPSPMEILCHAKVKLRQVEFIAENSHDSGDVDGTLLELGDEELMALDT